LAAPTKGRDMMRALVFGKTGQVARELQRLLPDARFLGRREADLADPAACAAAIASADIDVVINAAAWTAVDKAEAEEAAATVVNGAAPTAMARAAADRGVPFLHLSTDYVFDGNGNRPFAPDHPTAPLNAYGRSKLAGELGVRAAGGSHLILRTSWVFSAHGMNFLKTMLRLGRERDTLRVVADQIGGPTPADDIANTLVFLAGELLEGAPGGTQHYAGAPNVSWADFARAIIAQAELPCRIEDIPSSDYPTPARRPLNSRLDCQGLQAAFGVFRPDWRQGLSNILKELTP
jgi:dTDP-4-dehydrorhamnose reductase